MLRRVRKTAVLDTGTIVNTQSHKHTHTHRWAFSITHSSRLNSETPQDKQQSSRRQVCLSMRKQQEMEEREGKSTQESCLSLSLLRISETHFPQSSVRFSLSCQKTHTEGTSMASTEECESTVLKCVCVCVCVCV